MAKDKQTRTYDQEGFRRRAACLCVRDPEESEIMLVTSSRAPEFWIVPGGGVEPDEDTNEAAIRETEEEAGVKGIIKRFLGVVENLERKHRTSVYVLEVREMLEVWEDSKSRKRSWFSVKEAFKLLQLYKPVECTYLKLMIQTSPSVSLRDLLSSMAIDCNGPLSLECSSKQSEASSIQSKNNDSKNSSQSSDENSRSHPHGSDDTSEIHNLISTNKNEEVIIENVQNQTHSLCDTSQKNESNSSNLPSFPSMEKIIPNNKNVT